MRTSGPNRGRRVLSQRARCREVTTRSPGREVDTGSAVGHPPGMTDQRYSIPVDDLVSSARVDVTDQVELQAEPQPPAGWSPGVLPYGDGMSGDADGD